MTAARRGTQTRSASAADARSYLNKAREFLRAAEAADAITAARAAVVWKGEHSQSPAHLERVGGYDGRKAAAQLRRLLPLKNRAEYDPDPISAAEAKAAVTTAARMVRIAEQTVKQVER